MGWNHYWWADTPSRTALNFWWWGGSSLERPSCRWTLNSGNKKRRVKKEVILIRTLLNGQEVRGAISITKRRKPYAVLVEGMSPLLVDPNIAADTMFWCHVSGFYLTYGQHPAAYYFGALCELPREGTLDLELTGSWNYVDTRAQFERIIDT